MATTRKQTTPTGTVFFQAVWSVYGIDGKRKRMTKSFDRERDAKAHAAKMEVEQERRGIGDAEKLTVTKFLDRVMAHWRKGPLASTSIDGYERLLEKWKLQIGHMQLSKVTPFHIDEAMGAMKVSGGVAFKRTKKDGDTRKARALSDRTMLHLYRCGSKAFKQAMRWKLIADNPFQDVDTPKPAKKVVVIMKEDEAMRVYEKAVAAHETGKHPGMDLLVSLLFVCGMRRSEVLGLCFDAVSLDDATISIFRTVVQGKRGEAIFRDQRTKSDASMRTISIPAELVPMIKRHKATINEMALAWGKGYKREPLLMFPTFGGEPLTPGVLTTRLRQLHRQAKVMGVAPTHGFRHGMASRLVADGVDVKTVADRLGHGTVAFTLSTYVHTVDGKDRAAAEKLAQRFLPKR